MGLFGVSKTTGQKMAEGPAGSPKPLLKWRIVPDDEPRGEPVPINCLTCCDTGTIPSDPIFVNTASHYGTEYRSEAPCPDCNFGREDGDA